MRDAMTTAREQQIISITNSVVSTQTTDFKPAFLARQTRPATSDDDVPSSSQQQRVSRLQERASKFFPAAGASKFYSAFSNGTHIRSETRPRERSSAREVGPGKSSGVFPSPDQSRAAQARNELRSIPVLDEVGPCALAVVNSDDAWSFCPAMCILDLEGWYYQSAHHCPSKNCIWVCVPSAVAESVPLAVQNKTTGIWWLACKSNSLAFGSLTSVYECVGQSEILQFTVARVCRIVIVIYIDDGQIISRLKVLGESESLYALFLSLAGRPESTEKRVSHSRQQALTGLGIAYDLNYQRGAVNGRLLFSISASLPQLKVEAIASQIDRVIVSTQNGSLEIEQLLSVRGAIRWGVQFRRGVVMFTACLNQWCEERFFLKRIKIRKERAWLIYNLITMKSVVLLNKKDHLHYHRVNKPLLHGFTDASGEFVELREHRVAVGKAALSDPPREMVERAKIFIGGWIDLSLSLDKPDRRWFRFQISRIPAWAFSIVVPHIGVFELLAVCVMTSLFANQMKERLVIAHIDNLGDVWALGRASTKCPLCRALAIAFFFFCEERDIDVYSVWLSGARNVLADAATRKHEIIMEVYPDSVFELADAALVDFWWNAAFAHWAAVKLICPGGTGRDYSLSGHDDSRANTVDLLSMVKRQACEGKALSGWGGGFHGRLTPAEG
jgi:hypothetical protein